MDNTAIDIVEPMQVMDASDQSNGLLNASMDNIMYMAEMADKQLLR